MKRIPLNIVMTYPVHWNCYQVMRDFVQNFYDAVGYLNWKKSFHYSYNNNVLCMWVDNVSFNYEWLLHIGASTKTAKDGNYAGYFGEGFKIAALCGYRDYGWSIQMSSQDWQLKVVGIKQMIDVTNVDMLAYEIENIQTVSGSKLVIGDVDLKAYSVFVSVLESFYFPENNYMGEKIWTSEECAIYYYSKKDIDYNLPITREYGKKGVVFCGFQMLGTNPFGLVVCLHKYKKEDRERRGLYSFEVIDVFEDVCRYIDSRSAMIVLEKMRRYWNSYPQKNIDINSWSYVVDMLIRKVSESTEFKELFMKKYDNLLYLKRIGTIGEKNRRGQARAWLSQQDTQYLLVKDTFEVLGYPSLEEKCEEKGGFVLDEEVNGELERNCFTVLEEICETIFASFFITDEWPKPRIITNPKAAYHGMAVVHKRKNYITNNKGLKIRYDISKIYLKKDIFCLEGYYDGLSTYIHELCHMFGGDASVSFSQALTYAIELLMENHALVLEEKAKWGEIFRYTSEEK